MDQFLTKLAEQAAVIKAAPYPFAVAVLIVAGAIWLVVNYAYSTVLSSKNAQLELADRKISDYKEKLNGASPDQAAAAIAGLEKQVASLQKKEDERIKRSLPPLAPEQIVEWSGKLKRFKPQFLQIESVEQNSPEFRESLYEVLKEAGWPMISIRNIGPTIGVKIVSRDQHEAAAVLVGLFSTLGVPVEHQNVGSDHTSALWITIGSKG